jgi:hypothetical protein
MIAVRVQATRSGRMKDEVGHSICQTLFAHFSTTQRTESAAIQQFAEFDLTTIAEQLIATWQRIAESRQRRLFASDTSNRSERLLHFSTQSIHFKAVMMMRMLRMRMMTDRILSNDATQLQITAIDRCESPELFS